MRPMQGDATRLIVALLLCLVAGAAVATGGETLVYRGGSQGKVVFDGRVHAAKGYRCTDCHAKGENGTLLFATARRGMIAMDDHAKDAQCFACHNGVKAFNDCAKCHRGNTAP